MEINNVTPLAPPPPPPPPPPPLAAPEQEIAVAAKGLGGALESTLQPSTGKLSQLDLPKQIAADTKAVKDDQEAVAKDQKALEDAHGKDALGELDAVAKLTADQTKLNQDQKRLEGDQVSAVLDPSAGPGAADAVLHAWMGSRVDQVAQAAPAETHPNYHRID